MHETEVLAHRPDAASPARRRKRIFWIGALLLLLVALLSSVSYWLWIWEKSLHDAIAEADRLDPGWRIEELEANRAVLPGDQNSALALMAARQAMPTQWPIWEYQLAAMYQAQLKSQSMKLEDEDLDAFEKRLHNPDPPVLLSQRHLKILRDELTRAAPALAEAHKILALPHGRYPITYTKDYISTPLPYIQDARSCANWFAYEATLRAQDQDLAGALTSCRGIFSVSRSIGDEPNLISTLVRIAIRQLALRRIEQALALGQPTEGSLAALQRFLEDEEKEPLFLIGMRGERALMDGTMQAVQNGDITFAQLSKLLQDAPSDLRAFPHLQTVLVTGSIRNQRAALLRWMNRAVEIAKLSPEEQKTPLKELEASAKDLPVLGRMLAPACAHVGYAWSRDQVSMRCAITLVAVERYRQAHGRWPQALSDLVPQYLPKVPIDLYDGSPLRLGRFTDGVVVYSVGEDGIDNGGNVDENPRKPGTDWGYRLWDVARRRQRPKEGK